MFWMPSRGYRLKICILLHVRVIAPIATQSAFDKSGSANLVLSTAASAAAGKPSAKPSPAAAALRSASSSPSAAPNSLRRPSLRAFLRLQNSACEFRNRIQRRPRRFTMRRMSGPGKDRHVDRTIALLLGDFDLTDCPILVVCPLQDRHRHADIGEVFRDIPVAKFRVEPVAIP